MKRLSEKQVLAKLAEIRGKYRDHLAANYEHRAKNCATCETPGACCLDAHFVNVHISRLEAAAIRNAIAEMPCEKREAVYSRVENAISRYNLSDSGDTFSQKFACPLYEKGAGCIVHKTAKPSACIHHACYETRADLPPDELLYEQERRIDRLNDRAYGLSERWLPLPVAIKR